MNFSSSDTGKKFHSELFSELKWQKVTISPEMFENGVNIVLEASCCECVSFKWMVFYEWVSDYGGNYDTIMNVITALGQAGGVN